MKYSKIIGHISAFLFIVCITILAFIGGIGCLLIALLSSTDDSLTKQQKLSR